MEFLYWFIVLVYALLLGFILLYSFTQLNLVLSYSKARKKNPAPMPRLEELPKVTVQLPIFNELFVSERLIRNIVQLDYPKDLLQIQVLDDSTDETKDLLHELCKEYELAGFDIQHIHRVNRQGYKAGALAEAMPLVKGSFIAIFDADFLPKPDFLKRTLPWFVDENVGVVQTKWTHINEDYNLLTDLQAFGLNAHFSVEQSGRNQAGHFINFNGTAGVWRKTTIENAGGWQSDTITEDLDLSYRAQLKGWKFIFREEVGSPSELPASMPSLKTQQYRWTKGAAECARKNLLKVWKTKGISFSTKVHALFHLMNSFLFICIIITALLSVPLLFIKQSLGADRDVFKFGGIFALSLLILTLFYWISFRVHEGGGLRNILRFIWKFPAFLSVSMGLSLHNAIAVLEGYAGKKTAFVRTPKFNLQNRKDTWSRTKYISKTVNWLTVIEGVLTLYFIFGLGLGVYLGDFGLFFYHIMLSLGFGSVYFYSLKHRIQFN